MSVNVEVRVKGPNVAAAISEFNKKCKNAGIVEEYRRRQFYEKPSEVRRRKLKRAKINEHKLSRKSQS